MASADSKVKELLKREKSGEIISLAEKDGEVVNEVVKLLGDSDWLVRKNAAEALGLIVDRREYP